MHTRKSRCLQHLTLDRPVRNVQNLNEVSLPNVLGVFEVCLELSSDSSDQFGFVVDKFSELVHKRKPLCSPDLELLKL